MDQTQMAGHEQMVRALVRDGLGEVDTAGLELLRMVKKVANLYDAVNGGHLRDADLSGPRFRLLMRLWAEEARGNLAGIPPTHLSHWQNVSKNTISALLRGLEEQGLIERTLDAEDHRVFRIRLTAAGRELVRATAPVHLAHLNQLAVGLTAAERGQLTELLQKLYRSLAAHAVAQPAAPDAETGMDLGAAACHELLK